MPTEDPAPSSALSDSDKQSSALLTSESDLSRLTMAPTVEPNVRAARGAGISGSRSNTSSDPTTSGPTNSVVRVRGPDAHMGVSIVTSEDTTISTLTSNRLIQAELVVRSQPPSSVIPITADATPIQQRPNRRKIYYLLGGLLLLVAILVAVIVVLVAGGDGESGSSSANSNVEQPKASQQRI